jgi:G-protein coupled receptor 98
MYSIVGGDGQFNDIRGKLIFFKGKRLDTIVISPIDDDIPELNKTYTVQLTSLGSETAVLGSRTSVDVTILQNDDANGVISFKKPAIVTFGEPSLNSTNASTVYLTVVRAGGVFGEIIVTWNVTTIGFSPPPSTQLMQVQGSVMFADGANITQITVSALADDTPEFDQQYQINLLTITGGAKFMTPTSLSLTIVANDDPVSFDGSTTIVVIEGHPANFTVTRKGQRNGMATVMYETLEGTANRKDYHSVQKGVLHFGNGVSSLPLTVSTLNDNIPETDESFTIQLTGVTGDSVLFGDVAATVIISANDDANGVIRFSLVSLDQSVAEGSVSNFIVERHRGTFGQVSVLWQIVDADSGLFVPPGDDLRSTSGVLVFNDTVSQSSIEVLAIRDGKPELDEKYIIELTKVTGGGPPGPGARLSSTQTQANLTILKNDDANGILSFATHGVHLPEDVEITGILPGSVNVTVVRGRGLFGSVEVSWDIIPSNFPNLASFSDLLFGTNTGFGVAEAKQHMRRTGSDTNAFLFNESRITVPSELHPSASIISLGFTLSAWVQPASAVNGYIIAKTTPDTKTRFYTLALLHSSGTHTDIVFDYLPSGPSTSISSGFQTTSVGVADSALIDGNWHNIAVSVGEQSGQGQANFYFDGKLLSSKRLSDIRVADREEQLIVGQLPDGSLQYLGFLQDVRVYHKQLTSDEINTIGSSQVTAELRPVAGYLKFDDSVSRKSIVLDAVSDTIPEPDEQFTILLSAVNGGAQLSAGNLTVPLTLLRSDNGNGLFGFTLSSLTATVPQEPDRVTLTVERKRGSFDAVDVHWDVRRCVFGADPLPLAEGDFQNTSGVLRFAQGKTSEDLILDVVSDSVPELSEEFVVTLVSADPSDGQVGSTPTSAASINPASFQANITIEMNDDPYGVLEFTLESPPTPADPVTQPTTIAPHIYVNEEDGTLNLTVVRANGLIGGISVEYRTVDGSAVGSGSGKDFIAAAGLLSFGDGERFKTVMISLVDDSIPELLKSFTLLLSNPAGSPAPPRLGVAKQITVTIQPSDDALGVVGFASDSLAVVVEETSGTVNLNVKRRGGALGPITVYWEAAQTGHMTLQDLTPLSGNVTFLTSQTTAQIAIAITNDAIPELAEVFMITLISVTGGGRISSSGDSVAVLTVQSNDEPHGLFVFSPGNRPLRVIEANSKAKLTVVRELGKMGNVTVFYQTIKYSHFANNATEGIDYNKTSGMLNFGVGEVQKSFEVTIYDDGIPELDESIFVNLTSAVLISGLSSAINSPRVGSRSEGGLAEIIIKENDNPYGVMQLSSSSVNVSEPNNGPFLEIHRTAGKFGSVTVKWDAVGGSATGGGVDFTPDSGTVIFAAQQMSAAIPIQILNDIAPEFDEQFSVRIIDVGVAHLGLPSSSAITIQQNDDPNGAFDFSMSSRFLDVEEPQAVAKTVTLTVERSGGLTGVITVTYEITLNGVLAKEDIMPAKGDIFFLTNQNVRTFDVSILPDDIPEGPEPYIVTLKSVSISGSGIPRIGSHSQSIITILANDGPHGQVIFNVTQYIVPEGPSTTTVLLSLYRSLGTVGELKICYKTASVNITTEAAKQGMNVLSFFSSPIQGFLSSPLSFYQSTAFLFECSDACLNDDACKSFSLNKMSSSCHLYTKKSTDAGTLFNRSSNFDFYEKDDIKIRPFVRKRAVSQMDYNPAVSMSNASLFTTIADGSRWGFINITINPDTVPELDETFHVVITSVQLSSGSAMNPSNEPTLGSNRTADVTILLNDEPHGSFQILSEGRMNVTVREQDKLAVPMTVERIGGTLGSVSVDWYGISKSALSGSDFTAAGATLKFHDGVNRAFLLVSVLDDNDPEIDETFEVALQNPTGGAVVLSRSDRVIVTISANDDVAGVIGFALSSRSAIVSEGQLFNMTVERQKSFVGVVTVFWQIDGDNPSSEFEETTGSLLFLPNQTSSVIKLLVKSDSMPETAEHYILRLHNISTVGVSSTGAAQIVIANSTASLTIKASNDPHGQVEFDSSSLKVTTSEGNRQVSLTVVRLFGSIGTIRVNFTALAGSISPVQKDTLALATSNQDFIVKPDSILMGDGVKSAGISVNILEDTDAEVDEAFLVNLTSVELIGSLNNTILPKLAANSLAEVIVSSNDGTRGEFVFASDKITVAESDGPAKIEILRKQGTFGVATVFIFVLEDGATGRGTDFDFSPLTVSFNSGEAKKMIEVKIVDDSLPELDERFLLRLTNPTGGAIVGKPDEVTVTITENDDPYGIISFLPSSRTESTREPISSSQSNNVQLTVIRQGGVFGEVIIQWAILGDAEKDLQETSGAIVFQDQESQKNIVVEVLADDVPELSESYDVILQHPAGGAVLASVGTTAVIVIDANDDPNGIIQLNFNETSANVLNVEETVGQIKANVKRSAGTFGRVTCHLTTQDGTAISGEKQSDYLAVAQTITTVGAEKWYSFTNGANLYILLASSNRTGDLPQFNTSDDGAGDQSTGDQEMSGSGINPSQSPGQDGQGPTPLPNQGGNGQQSGRGRDIDELDSGVGSGLYLWNGGGIERIQGITTNGAYSWTTFTVGSTLLSAVANFGEDHARETISRLYSFVNGRFQPSQDISTKGATDVIHFQSLAGTSYLVFANYEDNTGNRNINSVVLQGSGITFSHHQDIATQGARALVTFDISSTQYLAVANSYSTIDRSHVVNSQIFFWDAPNQMFKLLQNIPTSDALYVHHFTIVSIDYLVFCNGMDNAGDSLAKSPIYQWNTGASRFMLHQEITTLAARSIKEFKLNGRSYLVVASAKGQSKLYSWNSTSDLFEEVLSYESKESHDIHPLLVSSSGSTSAYLLFSEYSQSEVSSPLLLLAKTGRDTDYVARQSDIVFEEGLDTVNFEIALINDTLPEISENFSMKIANVQGGARLGSQDSIVVNILTNDNAHGLIGFTKDSLSKVVSELKQDTAIHLSLTRDKGNFGKVEVAWVASGTGAKDVSPHKGTVTFASGTNKTVLSLNILADTEPELQEMVIITLTDVVQGGVTGGSDMSKGAKLIPSQSASVITIEANDDPHGVISWSPSSLLVKTPEIDGADSVVTLTVVREFGTVGVLLVNYTTVMATDLGTDMQATPGIDYVSEMGVIKLEDNETSAVVNIIIKQDNIPEIGEYFFVNLTDVWLDNFTNSENRSSPPPRIMQPDSATILIEENDNSRGILVFSVTKALDGTVHVTEDAKTIMLTVNRTSGTFGTIGCSWSATPRSALGNGIDFSPPSGTLRWSQGDVRLIDT